MKIACSVSAVTLASLFTCLSPVREAIADDRLNAQIQRLRDGKKVAIIDTELFKLRSASFDKYFDAAAELYVHMVKWSLIDPDNHGGWPARSPLIMDRDVAEAIHRRLKERSDQTNDAIFDYARICPALYLGNDEEVQNILSRLEAKDGFLYNRATSQLGWWRDYISKRLGSKK